MDKKLSVVILTLDEEKFLPGCLKSVEWADEVLVVDSGSEDKTIEIAKKAGARVLTNKWKGFAQQHNFGAQEAQGEWLLFVDADERVSKELIDEIKEVLDQNSNEFSSYKIPHKNIILGNWLKHGGWYPEYQHRLIKKDALEKWVGDLHEHPQVKGKAGYLKGNLIHLTHRGLGWMLEKTIKYTKMEAKLRLEAEHPQVKVFHLFSAPIREFWYRAITKMGWRDGIRGWIEILYQAFNHFLIMTWLWEMQQEISMEEKYEEIDKKVTNEL